MTYRYIVRAFFETPEVAAQWLRWLREGHCREVLQGGARRAEILEIEDVADGFEVRYDFPDRTCFEAYELEHATGLREEGLRRFPTERGIIYERACGNVIHEED
jgi:hypothetical protein